MFGVTQITNPVLNVSEGKKAINNNTSGSKAASYTYDLINTSSPVVIDYLEFATDNLTNGVLRIYLKINGSEVQLKTLTNVGNALVDFSATQLTSHSTGLFSVLEYNDGSNIYKFGLNRPLYLPEGGRIQVANIGATSINLGCLVLGREL